MSQILVIDDDPEVLSTAKAYLGGAGHDVLLAPDGDEGLDSIRRKKPDLILCDVRMPRVNGYDVLRSLRQDPAFGTIPFVFVSTVNDRADVRAGMNLGADDYLTKPFTRAELLQLVEARLVHHARFRKRFEEQIEALRSSILLALPHELRTPLTGVLGFSQILLEDLHQLDPKDAQEMLASIHNAGKRLQRVVENFVLYVQLRENDAQKPLSLGDEPCCSEHDVVEEEALRQADERGRVTDLRLDLHAVSASVPPSYMRKICSEIIDNGFKFSDPGQPVEVRWFGRGKQAVLEVADNGRGMTPQQIAAIGALRQFERDLHEQQGIGLGLATAHLLVRSY
ncbi:MAG TPA: hybrid sensor histidine kinase/response regulator, partial [Rhodothermales bacterium]